MKILWYVLRQSNKHSRKIFLKDTFMDLISILGAIYLLATSTHTLVKVWGIIPVFIKNPSISMTDKLITLGKLAGYFMILYGGIFLVLWLALSHIYRAFVNCAKKLECTYPVKVSHGDSLPTVLARIRYASFMYSSLFTPEGRKIEETTVFHPELACVTGEGFMKARSEGGCIFVCNHPGKSVVFSEAELRFMISAHISMGVIVSGAAVSFLTIPDKCWQLDANEVVAYYKQEYDRLKTLYRNCITSQAARDKLADAHRRKVATHYDMLYYTRNI